MDVSSKYQTELIQSIRQPSFEDILIQNEPFALLFIKYLYIQDFISLSQVSKGLRRFIFAHKAIWHSFDVRPCIPEDVYRPYMLGQPRYWKLAGWHESLKVWGIVIGEYQRDELWRLCYVPYYSQELTTGFLRSIFEQEGLRVVKLNLDGMPVTKNVLFPLIKRLEGTLEELSLRFCLKLKKEDFVDLLEFQPTSTSSSEARQVEEAFPANMKRLYVAGTEILKPSWINPGNLLLQQNFPEIISAPTASTAYLFFQEKLDALLMARKVLCDVGVCSRPECSAGLGVRSFEKCTRCLRESDTVYCKHCAHWTDSENCYSCTLPYCGACSNIIKGYTLPASYEIKSYVRGDSVTCWICQACVCKDAPFLWKMKSLGGISSDSIQGYSCHSCETLYKDPNQGYSCPTCKIFTCCECIQSSDYQISSKVQRFMEHFCYSCCDPSCSSCTGENLNRYRLRQKLSKLYEHIGELASPDPPGTRLSLLSREVEDEVTIKTKEAEAQILEEMRTEFPCVNCKEWFCGWCFRKNLKEQMKDGGVLREVLLNRWGILACRFKTFCDGAKYGLVWDREMIENGEVLAARDLGPWGPSDPEYSNDSDSEYSDGSEYIYTEPILGGGDEDEDEDEDDWDFNSHRSHSSVGSW